MKPTHIMDSNLLYSNSTNLNINIWKNTFTVTSRLVFGQVSMYHGLIELINKINHDSDHEGLTLLLLFQVGYVPSKQSRCFNMTLSLWCLPRFLHAPPGTANFTSHTLYNVLLLLANLIQTLFLLWLLLWLF